MKKATRAVSAVLFAAALGTNAARASDVFWDTNAAVTGSSATSTAVGTWDGTNLLWNTDPAGGAGTFTADVGATNTGVFSAGSNATGSFSLNVTGTRQAGGLRVEEGGITLLTGTLNLNGPAVSIDIAANASLSNISGTLLTGASSTVITKTGDGLFSLGGVNTGYLGKWVINAGTLRTGGDNTGRNLGLTPTSPQADTITLNGGTLSFNNTGSITLTNRGITLGASGGTINFFGNTGSNAGTVTMGAAPITGSSTLTITGPTLPLAANPAGGALFGLANNTSTFTGKWVINGAEVNPLGSGGTDNGMGPIPGTPTSDAVTLNGGNIRGSASWLWAANRGITLGANGGGLHQITGGTATYSAVISGAGPLSITTDTGASNPTITLSAANTYTGATNINNFNASGAGVVNLTGSLASSVVTVNTTGTATTPATFNVSGSLASNTALTLASNATVNFTNAAQSLASLTGGGTLNLNGPTALTVGAGSYTGVIAGASSTLTKSSTGTLTLSGANTFTGATIIDAGKLAGTGSLSGPVTLNLAAHISPGIGAANATLTVPSLIVKAASNLDFTLGASGSPFGSSDQLKVTGNLDLTDGVAAVNLAATTSGTYHLIQYGSLTGPATNLQATPLPGFDTISLADDGVSFINATVTVTDRNWVSDAATGNWSAGPNWGANPSQPNGPGSIVHFLSTSPGNPAHTVTIDDADKTVGNIALDNTTAYTIAATGANKLILDTYGNNAAISVANGSHSITAPLQLNKNTDVAVTSASDTLTLAAVVSSGSLTKTGSGNLTITGPLTSAGPITNAGGGALSIGGALSGAGSINNTSTGSVVLSATNSYSGGTVITAGSVSAAAPGALGSGPVTINGTLDVAANNQGPLGTVTLNSGSITGTAGVINAAGFVASAGTISARLGGSTASLTKSTTGTLTITGSNSFGGGTTITDGTLIINSDAALGTAPLSPAVNFTVTKSSGASPNTTFVRFDDNMTLSANRILKVTQTGNGGGPAFMVTAGKSVTILGDITSSSNGVNFLVAGDTGTLNLRGNNSTSAGGGFLGGMFFNGGTVNVVADQNFSPGGIQLNGGTGILQFGAPFLWPSTRTVAFGGSGGAIDTNGFNQTITGVVSGTAPFTKKGPGALTLTGANTLAGSTTVAGGSLVLTSPAWAPLTNTGGAILNSGKLVFDYGTTPATAPDVRAPLKSSHDTTNFTDPAQRFRTTNANDANHGIGYVDNTAASTVTVAYTWYGDANLDGSVNGDDYALLDRAVATGASALWVNGDFNYDNVIDSFDYMAIDTSYLIIHPAPSPEFLAQREAQFGAGYVAALTAAVPEPSCLMAVSCLVLKRRRKSRVS